MRNLLALGWERRWEGGSIRGVGSRCFGYRSTGLKCLTDPSTLHLSSHGMPSLACWSVTVHPHCLPHFLPCCRHALPRVTGSLIPPVPLDAESASARTPAAARTAAVARQYESLG